MPLEEREVRSGAPAIQSSCKGQTPLLITLAKNTHMTILYFKGTGECSQKYPEIKLAFYFSMYPEVENYILVNINNLPQLSLTLKITSTPTYDKRIEIENTQRMWTVFEPERENCSSVRTEKSSVLSVHSLDGKPKFQITQGPLHGNFTWL